MKPDVTAVTLHHSAVINSFLPSCIYAVKWNEYHSTDRDFLASNLREWSISLVFKHVNRSKCCMPHLALVESLHVDHHLEPCGSGILTSLKIAVHALPDLKACSWNMFSVILHSSKIAVHVLLTLHIVQSLLVELL